MSDTTTLPTEEVKAVLAQLHAYRLLAVNQGWSWPMAEAYGHATYLKARIAEVDRLAAQTVASGYDAAGYLRDGLARG